MKAAAEKQAIAQAEAERQAAAQAEAAHRASSLLTGKGVTGRVEVDDHYVTIWRKGALAKANYGWTRGEKRIAIASITAVQFKKPGATNGYIQFSVPGGNESTRGVMAATKDENTVVFTRNHLAEFIAIRERIEQLIARRHAPAPPPPSTLQPAAAPVDLGTQLRELASLRDEGLLTDDEYAEQKQRLLGR